MKIMNIPLIPLYRIYKQMPNNTTINDDIKRFGCIDFFKQWEINVFEAYSIIDVN